MFWFFKKKHPSFLSPFGESDSKLKILKQGKAKKVVFFYSGEEGTYLDQVFVTLFENGVVHLETGEEELTTNLRNCEILWETPQDVQDSRLGKLRLLKSKKGPELVPTPPTDRDPIQ